MRDPGQHSSLRISITVMLMSILLHYCEYCTRSFTERFLINHGPKGEVTQMNTKLVHDPNSSFLAQMDPHGNPSWICLYRHFLTKNFSQCVCAAYSRPNFFSPVFFVHYGPIEGRGAYIFNVRFERIVFLGKIFKCGVNGWIEICGKVAEGVTFC